LLINVLSVSRRSKTNWWSTW